MASIRINRISEDIKKELVDIFRSVKDPRVSSLLSIIKVDLSNDLSYCKVYVSALEGTERTVESVAGLKSAAGYIRREVSNRLHLRKAPEFRYVADDSIAYSAHINELLREEAIAHPPIEEEGGAEEISQGEE